MGNIVLISLFAVLTAIGALIVIPIPFSPVPITLQTLFCMLAGAILGKNKGMLSQLVYIFLGIAGLPVFSKGGSGIGFLFGPTGGYVIGFVIGAYLCGLLTEKKLYIPGMILGVIAIYATGLVQLKFILGIKWINAFLIGAAPFIPGDIFKLIICVGVYNRLSGAGILEASRAS